MKQMKGIKRQLMSAPIHAKGRRQCLLMEQMISTTIAVPMQRVANVYVKILQPRMELVQPRTTLDIACIDTVGVISKISSSSPRIILKFIQFPFLSI